MELKDWLKSINETKTNLIDNDSTLEPKYLPYIVNRCMSGQIDTLMFANEMNISNHLDNKLQYDFLLYTCLLYTSPSPRDLVISRMPSSA